MLTGDTRLSATIRLEGLHRQYRSPSRKIVDTHSNAASVEVRPLCVPPNFILTFLVVKLGMSRYAFRNIIFVGIFIQSK